VKRLLVVDGLDGCGKDTHASRIKAYMEERGERVTLESHPSPRWAGRVAKKALQRSGKVNRAMAVAFYTIDVLASVRRYSRAKDGTTIFVRYLLGTAYLPRWLAPFAYRIWRRILPFPDLALFVDIEPEVAIARIEARDHKREMFETIWHLRTVRETAKMLVNYEWVTVDNSTDGERPFTEVRDILVERRIL